jgi:hypothetical protein
MSYEDEATGMSYLKVEAIINGTEQLQDKYEIENVLLVLQNMTKKIEFLKELKKRRVVAIDEQIQKEESDAEKLEEAIKACMQRNKDKTLDFPGVGKVQVRSSKGAWTIVDDEGLRNHLQTLGKFDEVSETSWKFKKKDLNKLLDQLQENNNTSPFVQREQDKTSLSVSFPKEEVVVVAPSAPSAPAVSVRTPQNITI